MRFGFFTSSDKHYQLPLILAALAAGLAMIVSTWFVGAIPQIIFGHDFFALLEGGWKWKWGILPHRDYYSHMGPLIYLMIYLGMKMGGGLLMAIPAAVCLFAACLLPVCIYVTFSRLPAFLAFVSTFFLMGTVMAPYPMRYSAGDLGYSCIYNRWGYGILLVALFTVVLRPTVRTQWKEATDGLILGALISVAIFLKISYGLLLLTAPIGFAFFLRRDRSYYCATLCSAAAIALLVLSLIGWNSSGFLHDMSIAVHARKGLDVGGAANAFYYISTDVCCLLVMCILCCGAEVLYAQRISSQAVLRVLTITATYTLYSAGVTLTNSPSGGVRETPGLCIAAIVLLDHLIRATANPCAVPRELRRHFLKQYKWKLFGTALLLLAALGGNILYTSMDDGERSRTLLGMVVLFIAPVFLIPRAEEELLRVPAKVVVAFGFIVAMTIIGPNLTRNIQGLRNAYYLKNNRTMLASDQVFHTGSLAGLQISAYGGDPVLPTSYVGKVEDGLQLLERTGNADKPVLDMDFSNPFNVVRGVKPTTGAPVAWQLNMVYSLNSAPDANQVFNGAEVVMKPKLFGDGQQTNLAILSQLYDQYLNSHYRLVAVTQQWSLYVRK